MKRLVYAIVGGDNERNVFDVPRYSDNKESVIYNRCRGIDFALE